LLSKEAITKLQAIINTVIIVAAVIVGVIYFLYAMMPVIPSPAAPIRIGYILPLTGASARLGKEVLDGSLLALEEINTKGGLFSF